MATLVYETVYSNFTGQLSLLRRDATILDVELLD